MSRDFEVGTNVICKESTVSPSTWLIFIVFLPLIYAVLCKRRLSMEVAVYEVELATQDVKVNVCCYCYNRPGLTR